MKTKITRKEAELLMKELKKTVKEKSSPQWRHLLPKYFVESELGTGKTAYTTSGRVEIKKIKSKLYLNGTYLVVGLANRGFKGFGQMYRGYVVSIED